jgi:chitodextrinase
MNKQIKSQLKFSKLSATVYVIVFAVIGSVILLAAKAAGNSTISGSTFKDLNRNGVYDSGDTLLANQHLFFYKDDGTYLGNVYTDSLGNYSFGGLDDGNYVVQYAPASWWDIRSDFVPDTTGSIYPKIDLQLTGSATANFGWRPIVRSTDSKAPISTYTAANGLVINSYDDVISAQDIYGRYTGLSLTGPEAPKTTIRFDISSTASTSTSASKSGSMYDSFSATSNLSYLGWLDKNGELSHEYGHAWSLYHAYISQQDPTMASYIQARGLSGDSRLNTSYAWSVREIIAEDYRQLFGISDEQGISQLNRDIPLAKDVPGLKDFLQNSFTKAVVTGETALSAPTNLTATAGSTAEGPGVTLSWGASTGGINPISKYDIYREGQLMGSANGTSSSYLDTAVSAGASYSYYIKAVDSTGVSSAASNTASVTIPAPDNVPPTAPANLHTVSLGRSSAAMAWDASTDNVGVGHYQVYSISTAKGKQLSNLVATVTNNSFTASGLKSNTNYSYYVVAVDNAGNKSSPSSVLTVKTSR